MWTGTCCLKKRKASFPSSVRCLEKAGERPWDEQVDIRDRILELNKELLSVLTQL